MTWLRQLLLQLQGEITFSSAKSPLSVWCFSQREQKTTSRKLSCVSTTDSGPDHLSCYSAGWSSLERFVTCWGSEREVWDTKAIRPPPRPGSGSGPRTH